MDLSADLILAILSCWTRANSGSISMANSHYSGKNNSQIVHPSYSSLNCPTWFVATNYRCRTSTESTKKNLKRASNRSQCGNVKPLIACTKNHRHIPRLCNACGGDPRPIISTSRGAPYFGMAPVSIFILACHARCTDLSCPNAFNTTQ